MMKTQNNAAAAKRKSWLVAGLIAIQILILATVAMSYYSVSWFGQAIKVKTVPVDPRDIFYGDYVTLGYEMSRVSSFQWKGQETLIERGTPVYVVVRPGTDGIYVPVGAYPTRPEVEEYEVVLKGVAPYTVDLKNSGELRVNFGIEKYYVPENTGKALEDKASQLIVHLKVSSGGQAVIEALEDRTDAP